MISPNKLIMLFLIVLGHHSASFSQTSTDLLISTSGAHPSLAYDLHGGIKVVWDNLADAVHMKHLDSLGRQLEDSCIFLNTYASLSPQIEVGEKYQIVVWEDRLSNDINWFKTYIMGDIFNNDSISTAGTYLMFNNNPITDAIRSDARAGFLNDTTIVVLWDGNGDSTIIQSGVYGQISSTSGNEIGDNFLITDHISEKTNSDRPRFVYSQGKNFFIVIWIDNSSGVNKIYGRKFDLNYKPQGSSFLISDDSAMTNMFYYSAAQDTSGNFVAVWIADKGKQSQIEWRWYDNNGVPTTGVEQLTPLDTLFDSGNSIDVSVDERERVVLVWEQKTSVKFDSKIYARCFSSTKTPISASFKVSTNNSNSYGLIRTSC